MSERIWEKDYGPFRAFGYVAPEEMDVGEIFDQGADNLDEINICEGCNSKDTFIWEKIN